MGGNGFLGKHLVHKLLQSNHRVLYPDSRQLDLSHPNCVDPLSTLLGQSQRVIFLSAITPDRDRTEAAQKQNLAMAHHLANALQHNNTITHMTYVSSDAVYGQPESIITEQTPLQPDSPYGEMHAERESLVAKLPLPLAILRPTMLYGYGDTHTSYGITRFLHQAQRGRIQLFGEGEEYRDYIQVNDAAALILAINEEQHTGTWNLASGESICFYELARLITSLSATDVRIQFLERAQPVTHRHFDIRHLRDSFPNVHLTPLRKGLTELIR